MKKKFFAPLMGAGVLGLSAYAGYRTYDAYNGVSESDLLLANAEALASDDEGPKVKYKCYSSLVQEIGSSVVDCSDCKSKKDMTDAWYAIHDYCYRSI